MYADYYAGGHELTTPLISPLYAGLQGLPPVRIQVGSDEILQIDATHFAENAGAAGVDVKLEWWDETFYIFQLKRKRRRAVGALSARFQDMNGDLCHYETGKLRKLSKEICKEKGR